MTATTRIVVSSLVVLLSARFCEAEHLVTQALSLQPGWNAVYLEVQPEDNSTLTVFSGLPVESVWMWLPKYSATEFHQNMSEELLNEPQWLVFFPTTRVESVVNDLYRVHANRAYLLRIRGSNAVSWEVTGRPALPRNKWKPKEYNLFGFGLNPAASLPSVGGFFSHDAALDNQAVYRLDATGAWALVTNRASSIMRASECMWVYCNKGSDYMGPLHVTHSGSGDAIEFKVLTQASVFLENKTASAMTVSVRDVKSDSGPLVYWAMDTDAKDIVWEYLPSPLQVSLAPSGGPGKQYRLRLGVRREDVGAGGYETTLEIISSAGSKFQIPVIVSE